MAIDFLIFCLLLISFTINLLALSSFCMTPGLRTTAGRFVINLLIINLAGCCILAFTLIFIGNMPTIELKQAHNIDCNSNIYHNSDSDHPNRKQMIKENGVLNNIEQFAINFDEDLKFDFENPNIQERGEQTLSMQNEGEEEVHGNEHDEVLDAIVETSEEAREVETRHFMRVWSIDLAAALGGLSVLVVVGDTWMAVRDPLRYHGRVSKEKAWLLIALNWTLGIIFGVMSAYWQFDSEVIGKIRDRLPEPIQVLNLTLNIIFSNIFAYIYFVVIILLPFGFVCGMYWRIFSEAKENSQRMCTIQLTRPLLKRSSQNILKSDLLQSLRPIYSNPYTQKCNLGHWNFLTGFESTTNLRYIAYQALQIRSIHSSMKSGECCYMTSISQRLSNASSFLRQRKESRAARISILVVIMFLMSYLPYGFLVLLQGSQMIKNFPYSTELAIFLILQANLSSPFIFAYRYKRVRHGVSRLLGFDARSKKDHRHHKFEFLRFITKVSIRFKQYTGSLSSYAMNSSKCLTPISIHSDGSLQNTKSDRCNLALYLTNSASIQSGTMFGVFNAVVDIKNEYFQENTSILENMQY